MPRKPGQTKEASDKENCPSAHQQNNDETANLLKFGRNRTPHQIDSR